MNQDRREFLRQLAIACAAGFTRNLGLGAAVVGSTAVGATVTSATAATTTAAAAGAYGAGVRAQVLEVIVRQGMAGAPWKSICVGPMQVNGITEEEVEKEIFRRQLHMKSGIAAPPNKTLERWRKHREAMDALPHSKKSPCACKDCMIAVRKIHSFDYSTE